MDKIRIVADDSQASPPKTLAAGCGCACDGEPALNEKIANIFNGIGIPAHTLGYHYLREAIKLSAGNFEMVGSITTKLYPLVANRFSTNTCKVARGIHNAIEIAWNKGKLIHLNALFGIEIFEPHEKPSNSELIALLAEKIYLDRR